MIAAETRELDELAVAIRDVHYTSRATFALRDEFKNLGLEIDVDPELWAQVVRAQRQVERGFFEILDFMELQALRSLHQ